MYEHPENDRGHKAGEQRNQKDNRHQLYQPNSPFAKTPLRTNPVLGEERARQEATG